MSSETALLTGNKKVPQPFRWAARDMARNRHLSEKWCMLTQAGFDSDKDPR